MIGQYGSRWEEDFFNRQMNLLYETGLYDNIQFLDLYVKGREPILNLPDKVNHITYLGELEEDVPRNQKLYRAYNYIQQKMWHFSHANPDYKILFFHSLGVSHQHNPIILHRKMKWLEYMEKLLIRNWRDNIELLNFYDCTGTEYIPLATFKEETIQFYAPHYQGFFWWANANYIKKLDPLYFYQDVEWQAYLCELWIGSGNPKAFNFHNSWKNQYYDEIDPPFEEILINAKNHIRELKDEL